ncbi:MAG: LLM class flavin-dependent oxidoreductase [Chloroflexota bacterium]|jgi:alkanesulfonate monooxygenase SsuD/methylene tetrahydromethanopterin reductase-like flavin-dependent oxidoreductase (luciferase family)
MRIGVGLPNTIPGTPGPRLTEWARTAEEMGFSSLATIGRLVFPTYEELQALTAAAAVTDRIGLFSNVSIGPVYDRALLAKLAAGLDQVSEGRFVLGLATGWREEDYVVAGKEYKGRGKRLDADVEYMLAAWRGELVEGATKRLTPTPSNGESVPLAFGGTVPAAFNRVARYGIGWTAGGAAPDDVAALNKTARQAWTEAGRDGSPKLWSLAYYALGDGARETATAYLGDYYGDFGVEMAKQIPADADSIRGAVAAYEAAGSDEFIFDPVSSDLRQLELLAEALGDRLTS